MSKFHVSLKKVVDDSYDVEIGFDLVNKFIEDLQAGLAGSRKKFAVITDSIVKNLYGTAICDSLRAAGYQAELFVLRRERRARPAPRRSSWRMPCWPMNFAGTAV